MSERVPSLEEIQATLDFVASASDLRSAAAPLLEALGDWHSVREALSNESGFTPRAYEHDNGFLKIEMCRSRCGRARLRLHIWERADLCYRQTVHNHSFDFLSLILTGAFDRVEYEVRPAQSGECEGRSMYAYAYHRRDRHNRDSYLLRPYQRCCVTVLSKGKLAAGDMYTMEGKAFHTLDPRGAAPAATILVSREHESDEVALILMDRDDQAFVPRNARLLDATAIAKRIRSFELRISIGV